VGSNSIIDSESLSERGLVEKVVVVGSVFSRLFMDKDTGSTSKRLTCVRFATGCGCPIDVGRGTVRWEWEGWRRGVGRGIVSQSVSQRVPSWAFWVIIWDQLEIKGGVWVRLSFLVR